jgi:uncharacterized protein YdaU (DUF1376 family)
MSNAWYPHYPGDYGRDTAHLSLEQHGAYRLMLDHYYATSFPLPSTPRELYRICRASSKGERSAVDSVLSQFFEHRADGYHNRRADLELIKRAEHHARLSEGARKTNEKRWDNCRSASRSVSRQADASPQPQPQPQPQETQKNAATAKAAQPVAFLSDLLTVTQNQDAKLADTYPWVDRPQEYKKMALWLEANRSTRKVKNPLAFCQNWFCKIPSPSKGVNHGKTATDPDQRTRDNLRAAGFPD